MPSGTPVDYTATDAVVTGVGVAVRPLPVVLASGTVATGNVAGATAEFVAEAALPDAPSGSPVVYTAVPAAIYATGPAVEYEATGPVQAPRSGTPVDYTATPAVSAGTILNVYVFRNGQWRMAALAAVRRGGVWRPI